MKKLIFLLLLSISFSSSAFTRGEELTLSWTPPVEYTDGSPLSKEEISHYTVLWECDTGKTGTISVGGELKTAKIDSSPMLGKCNVSMKTVTKTNLESASSNSVAIIVKLPAPSRGGFR